MKTDMTPFLSRPVAHRGLHDGTMPENSLPAFRAAAEAGYPIETDVHFSKDGALIVFHDDSLLRMTGDGRNVADCTAEELKSLCLGGTEERIPTFEEFLREVGGKVPLLIEIKNMAGVKGKRIAAALSAALEGYGGKYAVQSFNPLYVRAYKKLHPEICCGVLSAAKLSEKGDPLKRRIEAHLLERLRLNFFVKPDFLSFCFSDYEKSKRARKFKKHKLAWTVRSPEDEKIARTYADNIIFEGYIPKES